MALSIRNREVEKLARELSRTTGESMTDAVLHALKDRLQRVKREQTHRRLADDLLAIGSQCARLPVLDARSDEQILGYDERGLPS